jgi:hypothetical protein
MFNCKCGKGLFRLAKEIQATEVISRIVAFQPPKQGKIHINVTNINIFKIGLYDIQPLNYSGCCLINKNKHCKCYEKVKFVHDIYENVSYKWIEENCYIYKKNSKRTRSTNNSLIVLHLKNIK